ncbi:MAG: hypothetical protein HY298_04605 [Verrucomicrobia bacterium]|nr:hypothetical protein [Verrucomicrobiota bacterium]
MKHIKRIVVMGFSSVSRIPPAAFWLFTSPGNVATSPPLTSTMILRRSSLDS